MADVGRRMTDAEFRRLQAKVKKVYLQAYGDMYRKNADFIKRHEKKEARYRAMVDAGKLSKADFKAWMRGQVFQGKQWENRKKQMRETLLHADQIAMEMVNDSRFNVFANNANYIGYELEQHGRIDSGFSLYDENTVRRLLMEEPDLLPPRKVGKDKSYQWYNRTIQNAITQGIIQGEKLYDIAKRVAQVTGETNMNAMLRNARTMHTGAENAGRIEGLHQAQRLGIRVKKKWLAFLDNHTRDSHRVLDGKTAEIDEPFKSPLGKIMFPGDPNAESPADIWNCRCSLIYDYPEYPDTMAQRRDALTGALVAAMSYKEWEHWKQTGELPKQEPEIVETIHHYDFTPAQSIPEAEEYARQFLNSQDRGVVSYKGIDLEYANTENRVLNDIFSQYAPKYKLDKIAPMNKREKIFKSVIDTSDACYHWAGNGGMFINPNFYKNKNTLDAHKAEIDKLMDICLKNGQELLDSGRYTGAKRTYVEALLRTKRQCVSQSYDYVEGTIVHESGHMLDDKLFRKVMKETGSPLAKMGAIDESRHKFGGGISGYAATSSPEYIAESFTAWWYGETDKLDPELAKVFEGAKSKNG